MFKKIVSWIKSVFTKDNVKRFVHEMELSVVATASTTVNGFVNDPANQACTVEAQLRREPGRRPPRSGAQAGARHERPSSQSRRTDSRATKRSMRQSGG